MAFRLPDGSIQLNDGRILYADSILYSNDLLEIYPLFIAQPTWPMIGGGGGGGSDGRSGSQGSQGGMGMTGGPQGFQGLEGILGLLGNQGNQGNQGQIGTGPQGVQGGQGFQGLLGNQAPQGNQGTQGAQGFQGPSALTGFQGSQGFQGNQGNQGSGGPTLVSVFDFTHLAGAASTGALGFTPKFAFYSGVVGQDNPPVGGNSVTHSTGFATGTGALAKTTVMGVLASLGVAVDAGGAASDSSAIGGDTTMSATVDFLTALAISLDVTTFGAGGITLTWTAAVDAHEGKLIVVGN